MLGEKTERERLREIGDNGGKWRMCLNFFLIFGFRKKIEMAERKIWRRMRRKEGEEDGGKFKGPPRHVGLTLIENH